MSKRRLNQVFIFTFLLVLWSCVTVPPPNEEYTLAKIALDSARAVQSARYSPGYWHQAEEFFRRAKILYSEREFEEARNFFVNARLAAEKAENSARLLRQKNGDVL
ncbi:MAG: DUF4398 domain-containing protein [Pseudobdellovibrio sp.]